MWQIIAKAGPALLKMLLAIVVYFSPVKEVFLLMLGFVGFDLLTGIMASRNRNVPRSSRRLRKSVVKVTCYIAAVLLAFWAEQALALEWFATHRFIAGFICVVEFVSILENLAVISGHPVFLKIIKIVRGKASADDVIKEIINEKNEPFNIGLRDDSAGLSGNKDTDERKQPSN